jgi:hypothetical protein
VCPDHLWGPPNLLCNEYRGYFPQVKLILLKVNSTSHSLQQLGQTGDPRPFSGPRPLVTRPAKLFVNFLLVTIRLCVLFTRLLLYVHASATHATFKPCLKMQVSSWKLSVTSCCNIKFKIMCNSIVVCAHYNTVYIWAYGTVICHIWVRMNIAA